MLPYRSTAVALLTAVLALGTLTAVAAPATAAGPAPLAPAELHPDGVSPFEQAQPSPVEFEAGAAAGDNAGASGHVRYVVQQRTAAKSGQWQQVASRVGQHAEQITLPDGDSRWRARFVATDGTLGPWSAWIRFTVDSRRPATPTATIPDGPVTVGVPVSVTITSPDGLAAYYYLDDFGGGLGFGRGQDPCQVPHVVCVAPGQTQVTVPWTFLEYGFPRLDITTYGRNGLVATDDAVIETGLTDKDTAALSAAARWSMPTNDSSTALTVPNVRPRMPGLRLGPAVTSTVQQLDDPHGSPATVDVPSVDLAVSSTAHTAGPAVDTGSTFSVGAVLSAPTGTHGDLTVFDQPGVGGSAFSLILRSGNYWRFCVTNTTGESACSDLQASPFDPSEVVVGRYDAVRQVVSLSVGQRDEQVRGFLSIAPVRAASGDLRFGAASVRGTTRYAGPLGSPFVARGWIDGEQLSDLLTGSA